MNRSVRYFGLGEAWRENKMNFQINIENLGDLTPQERDEAIFRLGAEYGARAMAKRFLQDLDAIMKANESKGDGDAGRGTDQDKTEYGESDVQGSDEGRAGDH